jgi:hypothetical protein
MLVPSVALVAAILDGEEIGLTASLSLTGSRRRTSGRSTGEIMFLADILGATLLFEGDDADAERAELAAAARIVGMLTPMDVVDLLPHVTLGETCETSGFMRLFHELATNWHPGGEQS